MCGGFTCSKNALISLNILYVVSNFRIKLLIFFVLLDFPWKTENSRTSLYSLKTILPNNWKIHQNFNIFTFKNTQKEKIDNLFLNFPIVMQEKKRKKTNEKGSGKLNGFFSISAGGIFADWCCCVRQGELFGCKSSNHRRHFRLWSDSDLHSISGIDWSCQTSSSYLILLHDYFVHSIPGSIFLCLFLFGCRQREANGLFNCL